MTAEARKAVPTDVPALLPLVGAYWAFEGIAGFEARRIGRALERLLSEPRLGGGWLAFANGGPVGYLLGVYVFSLEHGGLTAEIDELFVVPHERHTGAGSALLRAAEAEFVRIGCTNVSLQLSKGNEDARRFYLRHGYGERAGYELLEKTLRGAT